VTELGTEDAHQVSEEANMSEVENSVSEEENSVSEVENGMSKQASGFDALEVETSASQQENASTFTQLLVNTAVSGVVSSFLWFALTFWVYLETKSVLTTSVIGAAFSLFSSAFAVPFGTYVDRNRKHLAMVVSSIASLIGYSLSAAIYIAVGPERLLDLDNPMLWIFIVVILGASMAGNLRGLAMATCVTLLVPVEFRDKANGKVGMSQGLSFAVTSVFSGLVIGRLGMGWAIGITITLTAITLLHVLVISIPGDDPAPVDGDQPKVDFRGTWSTIKTIPGLIGLIGFASFNNFLGGVFMSLLDPYGLSLVSVEVWGFVWGGLSFTFLVGGALVATRGVGPRPLRSILFVNVVCWLVCSVFALRSSIVLLTAGMAIWMTMMPLVEAAEQTVLQRVVPFDHQGRVFGFAQMVENAASPVTSLLIGPIAQFGFIPFMTDGAGARTIGSWFGTGEERGIALIFTLAGIIGLIASALSWRSSWFRKLTKTAAS
jgi:MFS transporter, DHA3 family, multidrug efflux protein